MKEQTPSRSQKGTAARPLKKRAGRIVQKPAAQGIRVREPLDESRLLSLWAACFGPEPQAPLSELCALCKDRRAQELLNVQSSRAALRGLLTHPAPKVRKNAARLTGLLATEKDLPALSAALEQEEMLFVIPSLILAMGCTGPAALEPLRTCRERLLSRKKTVVPEKQKHLGEIRAALDTALSRLEEKSSRQFTGLKAPRRILLCAPAGCGDLLLSEATEKGISGTLQGDRLAVKTADYPALFFLRCFHEALFPLGRCSLPASFSQGALAAWAQKAAGAARDFLPLLSECFSGESNAPFAYRIELRGVCPDRSAVIHALTSVLSGEPRLRNAPSSYEAELRIELERDTCFIFARLFRPEDPRFAYRKGTISASIHPVTAACLMRFAQPWLKEGGRVIDPCCGTGTLLAERALLGKAPAALVGVDIAPNALTIARENIQAARDLFPELAAVPIELLGGNLLSFHPRKPFDELIANLPFGTRVGTQEANKALYSGLMRRLREYLAPDGRALLYTTQKAPLLRLAAANGWKVEVERRFEAGGLSPWGIILRRR